MRVKAQWLIVWILSAAFSATGAQSTPDDSTRLEIQQLRDHLDGISENLTTINTDVATLKWLKVSGYVQARFEYNDTSRSGVAGGYDVTKNLNANNFYIRRGRVKFTFQPAASSRYVIYFDASKDKVSLKEAYVELNKRINLHGVAVTMGQFNIPFGYEIEYSSSKRDFPERSLAENNLFKGERDRGLNITWAMPRYMQFNVAFLQGYGIEDSKFTWFDPTKRKDFVARAKAKLGMVDFGVSGYFGETYVPGTPAVARVPAFTQWYDANGNGLVDAGDSINTIAEKPAQPAIPAKEYEKKRLGADTQLYLDLLPIGATGVRAEYYAAKDRNKRERGWYVWLSQSIQSKFAAAVRYDYWDPNTGENAKNDASGTLSLAAHYFWDANVRLTVAYDVPRTLKDNSIFSSVSDYRKQNRLTVQFQFGI